MAQYKLFPDLVIICEGALKRCAFYAYKSIDKEHRKAYNIRIIRKELT